MLAACGLIVMALGVPGSAEETAVPAEILQARAARAGAEAARAGDYDWEDFRRGLDLLAAAEGYRLRGEAASAAWAGERAARAFEESKLVAAGRSREELRDAISGVEETGLGPAKVADELSIVLRWQAQRDRDALRARLRRRLDAVARTREAPEGLVVALPDYFLDEEGRLVAEGCARIAPIAAIARDHPGLRLEVDGYGNEAGAEDRGRRLSEERAQSVADCLLERGAPRGKVAAVGFGDISRAAGGKSPARRVEIVVTGEPIVAEAAP